MNDDAKKKEFMEGLAALTQKTGIAIGGCGCCDSPYLWTPKFNDGQYTTDEDGNNVSFSPKAP